MLRKPERESGTAKSENAGIETSRQICLMCVRAPNSSRLSKLVAHTHTHVHKYLRDSGTDRQADTQLEI